MKRLLYVIVAAFICAFLSGCNTSTNIQIAATTAPVYEFASRICSGTDISVGRIINENVSCLHNYTLQTNQIRMIENAQAIIISGAGLEDFLSDILTASDTVIDASESIELLCSEVTHDHGHDVHGHSHEHDPHIWLSPVNARQMAKNICTGLKSAYPQYTEEFNTNLQALLAELAALEEYGTAQLGSLTNRNLITFHDGFAYLADAYDLHILHAMEEESGSEASAAKLIEICQIVDSHEIPAIFTEKNGSVSAAEIISFETGAEIYQLNMAMSSDGYFKSMYHNIDTLKEALG